MKLMKNKAFTQKLIILSVLIVMFLFFSVMKKGFASYLNVMTIALSTCVNGLLALGVRSASPLRASIFPSVRP